MIAAGILSVFSSLWIVDVCLVHAFVPSDLPSRIMTTNSMRRNTKLYNIGLGPEPDNVIFSPNGPVGDIEVEIVEEPDHELYRTARMTDFCKTVDEWYGSLLTGEGSFLGEVSADALKRIETPVKLKKEFNIPNTSKDWNPYHMGKLPGSIVYPAYGLETYGLPTPRRKAEAWKTFDLKGLVSCDYSETQKGVGTDIILDESLQTKYIDVFKEKGVWVSDEDCAARLVYVNGRFAPSLSISTDFMKNLGPDYFSSDDVDDEIIDKLKRLPDGFTDRLAADVPTGSFVPGMEQRQLSSFKALSEPYHEIGDPEKQYAINGQQGTACFVALNSVKAGAVSYIQMPPSSTEERPFVVLNAVTADGGIGKLEDGKGVSSHPRCLVTAGDNSALSFVQACVDLDESNAENSVPSLVNSCTQVYVGSNANVTHSYLEETGGAATGGVEAGPMKDKSIESPRDIESKRKETRNTHFETIDAHVTGEDGRYEGTVVAIGGNGRSRVSISASLLGPGSHGAINGFSLAGGNQRADVRTFIHHVGESTTSKQAQKNMIGGRATTSFRGRIRVEQNAQKTDTQQLTRNILLSDRSKVWVIPSLEIVADDVMCTHGATISDLSTEELYYLSSRGISKAYARNLLMYAFVDDVTKEVVDAFQGEKMASNSLKNRVISRLQNLVPRGDRAFKGEYQSA